MRARRMTAVVLGLGLAVTPVAEAAHSDGIYEQPHWSPMANRWKNGSSAVLDVIIVPPNHGQIRNNNGVSNGLDPFEQNPFTSSYLRALERSIADWDRAVAAYGSAWFAAGFVTNVYVLGRDEIPDEALDEPEILIITDENKGPILGFAFSSDPCLVNNSKFFINSMNYEDMFNINAQEYGHCLGLDHVAGDADRVNGDQYKGDRHDPMNGSYPHTPGAAGTELHCVSNLNIKGLEEVFRAPLTGVPGANLGTLPVSQYVRPAVC